MDIGIALLSLLGIALLVNIFDDDDDDAGTPASQDTPDDDAPVGQEPVAGLTIPGTEGADTLTGGEGDDSITGAEGNDDLFGAGGDDTIEGGPGDDIAQGNAGSDLLIGNEGDDLMQGRGGDDTLQGFSGDDWVDGNDGDDVVRGGAGDDVVAGGAGADALDGRAGDDLLISGAAPGSPLSDEELAALRDGTDIEDIVTGVGELELTDDGDADTLVGGTGDDIMVFGAGDSATGDAGADIFAIFAEGAGDDPAPAVVEDYAADEDALALYFQSDVTLADAVVTVEDDGDDALISVDGDVVGRVVGAAGAVTLDDIELLQAEAEVEPVEQVGQTIEGDDTGEPLAGTVLPEAINGNGGDDDIEGGGGADTISGGEGNDVVQGQAGFDEINGDAGNDLIQGRGGSDSIDGGADDDWVDGNDNADTVDGGEGDDTVVGGLGADVLTGGDDDDVVVAGELLENPLSTTALSALRGGATLNDALSGVEISESLTPVDDGAADTLDGGSGSDLLLFGAGDTATGGAGVDAFGVISGGDAPAIITDFDSAEDEIFIVDPAFDPNAPAPAVAVMDDGADALIMLEGTVIARAIGGAGKVLADDITVQGSVSTSTFEPNQTAPMLGG
ncbi:MAG: hypothetical protein AAFY75_01045 [Pseudomonadota bacterium]